MVSHSCERRQDKKMCLKFSPKCPNLYQPEQICEIARSYISRQIPRIRAFFPKLELLDALERYLTPLASSSDEDVVHVERLARVRRYSNVLDGLSSPFTYKTGKRQIVKDDPRGILLA